MKAEKERRVRTWVERDFGFWCGDPVDLGYLTEAERAEIPSTDMVLVDPEDLRDVVD